jgi:hypothetical protein
MQLSFQKWTVADLFVQFSKRGLKQPQVTSLVTLMIIIQN